MNQNQKVSSLLKKYMDNSCSKEEFDELFHLIKSDAHQEGLDDAMAQYWNRAKLEELPNGIDWSKMYSSVKRKNQVRSWKKASFKYAACIALIAFVYSLTLYKNAATNTANGLVYVTTKSAVAKTKVIVLADGTKVTLNANSKLRYPANFTGKLREVYLTGEAYFEVVHNDDKPFIIYSGKLKTQVLGTTFTVKAYAEAKASVTVLTGKVGVMDKLANTSVILTRGQSAARQAAGGQFKLSHLAEPEDAIAWMDDKLMFDNTNLTDVAESLSDKYGVKINITNNRVAKQRITAIFQKQSLPDILRAITRLTHSKYSLDNNSYTLY